MKKIAVVAANGRVSQKVVKEAQDRGFEVVGFGRGGENKSGAATYINKDIMELTKADLAGFDAVVDGFGAWTDEEQPMHVKTSQHLCDLLSGTDTRLLIVGGAGSLYVNAEHTVQVTDGADFPAMFLPLANAQGQELEELRKRNDVKWTFISPAGDFQADGGRTGKYILAGEELTLNSKGESIISYADYAIAMVDEIEKGNHIQQRISVVRE
ncbi:MAG: NAD(P)H-binding protein [Ruminococcus sp.]|nr:NAD(P)H-binding protein [Ruminococcus sp.]